MGLRVILWAWVVGIRLVLVAVPGHPVDVAAFTAWALRLAEVGPWGFYRSGGFVDYLPGYLLVLWPVGVLGRQFPALTVAAVKAVPALADFAVAALLRRLGNGGGRKAAMAYLLNPAVLAAGVGWGQAEPVAVGWLLASVWAWRQGWFGWSGVWFALAALTKPQYALAGVLLLAGTATGRVRWQSLASAAGWCVVAAAGCAAVFGLWPQDLAGRALQAADTYPYGSVNALNVWYLVGWNWKPDAHAVMGLAAGVWGSGFALSAWAWAGWRVAGRGQLGLAAVAASAAAAVTFSLATRMHERYLFPAVPFCLLAWAHGRVPLGLWVGLSGVLLANLAFGFAYLAGFPQYATPAWTALGAVFTPPVPQAVAIAGLVGAGWTLSLLAPGRGPASQPRAHGCPWRSGQCRNAEGSTGTPPPGSCP